MQKASDQTLLSWVFWSFGQPDKTDRCSFLPQPSPFLHPPRHLDKEKRLRSKKHLGKEKKTTTSHTDQRLPLISAMGIFSLSGKVLDGGPCTPFDPAPLGLALHEAQGEELVSTPVFIREPFKNVLVDFVR